MADLAPPELPLTPSARPHPIELYAAPETSDATFEAFYRGHVGRLVSAVQRAVRDESLAQEAVAEGMARCYARWATVSTYANPEGWVFRVATNWAFGRFRKRRREHLVGVPPERPGTPPAPLSTDLDRLLDALEAPLRQVVALKYVLDYRQSDIAEALGIPEGTVKSRLNRALVHLRPLVEEAP
jgi:RNA polymerase sigma-70 factor, ECF subfamily